MIGAEIGVEVICKRAGLLPSDKINQLTPDKFNRLKEGIGYAEGFYHPVVVTITQRLQ